MSTAKMSETWRQQYEEKGYYITPPLFDADTLDRVQVELEKTWKDEAVSTTGDEKRTKIGSANRWFGPQIGRKNSVCAAFCRNRALLDIAEEFLGPDVDLGWDQAIIKAPSKGGPFAWHQDADYAVRGRAKDVPREAYLARALKGSITCWVAITPTTIDNGTMWVLPGGHKNGLIPHTWNDETRDWQAQLDDSGKIAAELDRGQVLLFTGLTPHYTGPNVSDRVRIAYQIGYATPEWVIDETQIPVVRGGKPVQD